MPTKRVISADDLRSFQFVSDAQMSPDGRTTLFTVTQVHKDKKKNTYQSHIWKTTSTGRATQFTNSTQSESNPRWSPDGTQICFSSGRDAGDSKKGGQIWTMPADGGEGIALTDLKHGAGNPTWSPDGKTILFSSRVPIDPKEDKKKDDEKSKVIHATRLSYRFNGAGFIHKYHSHFFTISVKGGKPKQLTSGDWDPGQATWSPDGQYIYLTGNKEEDTDHTYARNIYRLSVKSGQLKKLTGLPGNVGTPVASPDGKTLVFTGSDFSRSFGTNQRLYTVSATGGKAKCISKHLDLSVEQTVNADARWASPNMTPTWSPDGKWVKFITSNKGTHQLCALNVQTGDLETYTEPNQCIESVSYSADHTAAAFIDIAPTKLSEVSIWRKDKPNKQVTKFNTTRLSRLELSPPEHFTFKASDGVEVEGWFMTPPKSRKQKHPTILQIHGGPRTAYGLGFMHEFQLLVANGYAVYYINPRGSSSYGEDWASAVGGHYGERDYQDIMEATDHVIKHFPVDTKRVGVTGGSYGGFMTNWIVGHTNRFKAAVTQRCISNFISFFGTSDIGWRFPQEELGGLPWDELDNYWKRSPLAYVKNVKTPTLIIHAEEDWRCPIEQAEQFFVALKMVGVDTELVRFPGESHELSRSGSPNHRIERLNHILRWFKNYL